jgi:hypothetical protein
VLELGILKLMDIKNKRYKILNEELIAKVSSTSKPANELTNKHIND